MEPKGQRGGRKDLLLDVLSAGEPSPGLLVRYADDPEALDPQERQQVEAALERSPAVADQLRVLGSFDASALDPVPEAAVATEGVGARLRRFFGALFAPAPAWVWAPSAAAALALIALVSVRVVSDTAAIGSLEQQLAVAFGTVATLEDELADARTTEKTQGSQLVALREELAQREAELIAARGVATRPKPDLAETRPPPQIVARTQPPEPAQPPVPPARPPVPQPESTGIEIAALGLPAYVAPIDAAMGFGAGRTATLLRSEGSDLPAVTLLAPEHEGRTVRTAPSLYWFLPSRSERALAVTLVDPERHRKLLDVTLAGPHAAGIRGLGLAAHGVRLAPDTTYHWFVSVLAGPKAGPNDAIASAAIRRVPASPDLERALREAGAAGAAHIYAEHGFWYDALDALSDRVERQSRDPAFRKQRAALLEQVGLEGPAEFDRRP